jgi:hypothetical protein
MGGASVGVSMPIRSAFPVSWSRPVSLRRLDELGRHRRAGRTYSDDRSHFHPNLISSPLRVMAAGARDDRRAAPRVDAKAVPATRRAPSPSIRCFVSGAQRSSASLHKGEAERQSKRSCSPQPIQAVAPPPKALGSHGLPRGTLSPIFRAGSARKTSVRLRYKRVKRAFRKLRGFFSDRSCL